MKTLTFLFSFIALSFSALSQQTANLVIFSDQGEPFYAFVNSVKQNETAMSNVKITDLPSEMARIRIVFEDESLGSLDRNFMLQFGHEITARIMQNRKGQYVLRPFGEPVPISAAPVVADQPVIIYHAEPASAEPTPSRPANIPVADEEVVQTTVVVTEGERPARPAGQGASIGINVDGVGISMDVNINDETGSMSSTTTTTTTTTTTSRQPSTRPQPADPVVVEEEVVEPLVPGYSGPIGCSGFLMSDSQFEQAKKTISNQTFEDNKITVAKQISASNCLTTSQVKELLPLFTFEDSKLDFAKHAYDRTHDIGNYWMLNDSFTFSSSVDDLNRFIQSRR